MTRSDFFPQRLFSAALLQKILIVFEGFLQKVFSKKLHSRLVEKFVLANTREQIVHDLKSLLHPRLGSGEGCRSIPIPNHDRQHRCKGKGNCGAGKSSRNRIALTPSPDAFNPAHRASDDGAPTQVKFQVVCECRARIVTPSGVLAQTLEANRFQIAIDRCVELPESDWLIVDYLAYRLSKVRCLKRSTASEQMIERCPKRIEIGRGGDFARVLSLLWRHVGWGPHDLSSTRQSVLPVDEFR